MKRWVTSLLALFMIVVTFIPNVAVGASYEEVKLVLNGKELNSDVPARIVDNYTVVPINTISKATGADISWDGDNWIVTVVKGGKTVKLTIGNKTAYVNGVPQTLPVAPFIENGRTLVPLRFVGEVLGLDITWDGINYIVYMTDKNIADKAIVHSISLTGNDLHIFGSSNLQQPKVFTLSSPERIVMDIPNAKLGDQLESQVSGGQGILNVANGSVDKIRFSNFSSNPATVRIILDLKQKTDYKLLKPTTQGDIYLQLGDGNDVGSKFKVVIDAGHGGDDSGAISVNNKKEKDFTLAVAKKVDSLLGQEPKIQGIMTRSTDVFVKLGDRAKVANNLNADLFLSIHGNQFTSTSAKGTETWYTRQDASKNFAAVVQKHAVGATGFYDRGVKQGDLAVTRETKMPAALVEVGFLSNPTEEGLMYQDAFQGKVAKSLVAAIKEYLNVR
jgi:N-acetylmuramoyl-L-alanine amidase